MLIFVYNIYFCLNIIFGVQLKPWSVDICSVHGTMLMLKNVDNDGEILQSFWELAVNYTLGKIIYYECAKFESAFSRYA